MNQKDIIQRFIIENANIRGELVNLTASYQAIIQGHNYSGLLRTLLGETLVAGVLLSAIIKFKGRLTLQFQGKEPLKLVLAQCTDDFKIRGLIQGDPQVTAEGLNSELNKGTLGIIVSQEKVTARYQGIVAWEGNSLAKSVEGYFIRSEQIPTRLWIAVNETSAVGLLLQVLPHESSLKSQPVAADHNWEHIIYLTETLTEEELFNLDFPTLLHRLYSQEEVRLIEPQPVEFGCTCSQKRSENAILMLGQEEAEAELNQKQAIVVKCEFCGKEYVFDRVDVTSIFKKDKGSSSQVH